jgi:hypothetical protein
MGGLMSTDGRHVLVIGLDGVRFDLLGPDATPSIWDFGRGGFLVPVPIDDATPTWSGPCWATIVTGRSVAEHGITGNDLTGHRLAEHPDFVTLATQAARARAAKHGAGSPAASRHRMVADRLPGAGAGSADAAARGTSGANRAPRAVRPKRRRPAGTGGQGMVRT